MILSVENVLDKLPTTPYTYSDGNIGATDTSFQVKNNNQFSANNAIQVGNTGEAEAEILMLSDVIGQNFYIYTPYFRFDHAIDVPVYFIKYDKIIFKRATAGTSGVASAIATVSIAPNLPYTEYDDTSGVATYAYKTQYLNSQTGDLSSESDWFVPGGPTFYSLQKIRQRVKSKLYNANYIKSDDDIDDWINEWLEELNTAAIKVNKDYLLGTTSVAFGTSGYGTITAGDFMYPRKVEITANGTDYVLSSKIPMNEYAESDVFAATSPRHSWHGDTVVRFMPAGAGGTARITYSRGEAVLTNDTDELPYPMRRYTRSFTSYALSIAYELDQKADLAKQNYEKAIRVKGDFLSEITPRDQTGSQYINMVESLSGMQEDLMLEGELL